jgi:cadmium resistance protein CadD (predicted permease)
LKQLLELVGPAVVLFISTDLDDVFVLLGFFADPRFRIRHIVAGQFIGIAVLYAVSVIGSLVSLVMPIALVGLLGLVPITMGLKSAWELCTSSDANERVSIGNRGSAIGRANIAAVFAMTVANGGDNVSVYIPLFAMRSASHIAIMGVVFGIMTAIWLYFAYWLTRHRAIRAPVQRYARLLMPFVFIALGVSVLYQARTVELLRYHMPPRATVIASPFTPPAASLHRNAITCATSRGSSTRFCG